MNHNVAYHFFEAARKHPGRIAIEEGSERLTYDQLVREVQQTVTYFRKMGISSGDRVLVAVPMGLDLYRIVLALFFMGATAVFLDEWVSFRRMELCCSIARCKGFIGNWKARLIRIVSKELRKIPVRLSVSGRAPWQAIEPEKVLREAVALMTFTTGSTGIPKAANRTHHFLGIQFDVLRKKVGGSPDDLELTNLPIVLLINLGVGSTSVIGKFNAKKPQRTDFELIYRQMNERTVNRLVVSPYFLIRLCAYMETKGCNLPNVTQVFTGGGPLFPAEAKKCIPFFPNAQLEVVYGSTEAEPISGIGMKELAEYAGRKGGLPVGHPDANATVRIIPIHNGEIEVGPEGLPELPQGEIGELVVSGPHVLKSYFNNEAANRLVKIRVGQTVYHRTGDSAYVGEDGSIFLTGRCAQVIEKDGKRWYPFLVEQELAAITGVERGACVAQDGRIVLFIQSFKGSDVPALEHNLQSIGLPFTEVNYLDQLPMDPRHHSKVDYAALERMAGFTT